MKNWSKLLGLVLFLGACSTTEDNFFKKVASKAVYNDATLANSLGTFTSDGKKIEKKDTDNKVLLTYTFEEVIDSNTGRYELIQDKSKYSLLIKTTDGVTGTIVLSGGTETFGLWFQIKNPLIINKN